MSEGPQATGSTIDMIMMSDRARERILPATARGAGRRDLLRRIAVHRQARRSHHH